MGVSNGAQAEDSEYWNETAQGSNPKGLKMSKAT